MQSICEMLESTGKYEPDRTAVIMGNRKFTYSQLNREINRLANGLLDLGLNKGDGVMLLIPNSLELLISHFAVIRAGAIAVPLNVMYQQREIRYIGRQTHARMIIADGQLWKDNASVREAIPSLLQVVVIGDAQIGDISFQSVFSEDGSRPRIHQEMDDIASIIFTSGTTGWPKGATQTHRAIISNVMGCCMVNKFSRNDCLVCALPLYNNFALNVVMMSAFFTGAVMVLIDRFDANKVLDHVGLHGATYFAGTPTMFVYLLEAFNPKKHNVSTLRVTNSGGANCAQELISQIEKNFGVIHLDGYGQTEGCGFTTLNPLVGVRKIGSCGLPISNIVLKIVDNNDQELPCGEVGEIVERGDAFSIHGYWKNPEVNQNVYRNGWFHSGDLGYLDNDGYLYVVGRSQDLIITAGQNIYPAEVEDVLLGHPKVSMAVVVGVPDKVKGELAKAYIILKEGESATEREIIDYVRGTIAKYKAPRMVEFVSSLPMGPTGKILRREIKEMHEKKAER